MRVVRPGVAAAVIALLLTSLPAGCVTVHSTTFDSGAPPRCCSFAWRQARIRTRRELEFERSVAGELVRERIAHALAARGIREDAAHPAFLVDFRAQREEHLDVNEFGYPRIYGSAPGPVHYDPYTTGTLVIEFSDPCTGRLLWRGTASAVLDRHAHADMYEIASSVDRLMRSRPSP
jgi:hypothetical protein